MNCIVKQLNADEINVIAECLIGLRTFLIPYNSNRKSPIDPGFFEKYTQIILNDIRQKTGIVYVINIDGVTAGYVYGRLTPAPILDQMEYINVKIAEVVDLYISDKYRHQGYGKMLMKKICLFFQEQKCNRISLVTLTDISENISFYKNCGFKLDTCEMVMDI